MDYPVSVPDINLLNGKFTNGDPQGGTAPSLDPAQWNNLVTDELLNIVLAAGLTPSETSSNQVASAIQSGLLNYGVDAGAANAYAVSFDPLITALSPGMVLRFKAIAANTGSSTLNVGTGASPIVGLGGLALQGGEIVAGATVTVMYLGAPGFVLLGSSGGAFPIAPATKANHAINLGQFVSSFTTSGYQKLPGGLIIQWGTFGASTQTTTTFNFPLAFPNACLAIAATIGTSIPLTSNTLGIGASGISKTQYSVSIASSSSNVEGVNFIAVGF